MHPAIHYLIDRADERSTWRGLILALSALGVSIDPELSEAIILAGVALAGLVEILLPDPAGKIRHPQ